MLSARAIAIAIAVFAVLWLALDSGLSSAEQVPGTTGAIALLALVFGLGAFVMRAGGRTERVPLLIGTALGTGSYAVVRALVF